MLSIAIINFKNPPLLRLCLKSLKGALLNIENEIIVIDISSGPETRSVVKEEFPEVKLVPFKENIGYTKGVNEALKNSKGDYIFIANPDIIPVSDAFSKLLDYAGRNPQAGLIGPQLLNFDGSVQNSCFNFYSPWTIIYRRTFLRHLPWAKKELNRFLMSTHDKTKISETDWLMGSALMTSRDAVEKVGFMDENLFLYMSEVDWARRFWENGYKVTYFPPAQMYHYHRRGSKGKFDIFDIINKETRWHVMDAFRYFRKHGFNSSQRPTNKQDKLI